MPAAQARRRAEPQAAPAARHLARGPSPRHAAATGMPAFAGVYLRRKAQCGCGRCAACAAAAPGVAVSQPGDALEREADELAQRVMRSAAPAAAPAAAAAAAPPRGAEAGLVPSGGQRLDAATRAFMEPRFGADFGAVRVHAGPAAGQRAQALAARAYAVGEHLVFGAGEYAPQTAAGRQLIAHELAHVVQGRQRRQSTAVPRTASPLTFDCAANAAGAGADPFGDLDRIDREAQGLAESMSIFATISTVLNPATGTDGFAVAYQTRFGTPQRVGTRFRNRFNGALRATEEQAAREEVDVIGQRFATARDFLAGPIRYRCRADGVNYVLGDCTGRCQPGFTVAQSCVPGDKRTIGICPNFWALAGDSQRAGALIHEAMHMRFDFANHSVASLAARGRNPECYTSMVADTFRFQPFDARCPPI